MFGNKKPREDCNKDYKTKKMKIYENEKRKKRSSKTERVKIKNKKAWQKA